MRVARWAGLVESVEIHMLEPGHTHNYLDALFSHLQCAKRQHTLCSVADLVDALQHAFSAERLKPNIVILERAFDWIKYFTPHIDTLAEHAKPLGFKFCKVGADADAAVRMYWRDNSKGAWLGLDATPTPIPVIKQPPRGELRLVPLGQFTQADRAVLEDTVNTATRKMLLDAVKDTETEQKTQASRKGKSEKAENTDGPEAKELERIVAECTLGVKLLPASSSDDNVGVSGEIARPGRNQSFAVRVIAQPPRSVQPPPPSRARAAAATKPPVTLFWKPRVAIVTNKKGKLRQLRGARERELAGQTASSGSASASAASASTSGSGSRAADERKSPAPVRSSPRAAAARSQTPSPAQSQSTMVNWDSVDDEMSEEMIEWRTMPRARCMLPLAASHCRALLFVDES